MKVWIYLDGRQQGPFELEELLDIEGLNENTKVWFEGLPKWYPAGSLEQMRPLFDGTLVRKPSQIENIQSAEPGEQLSEQDPDMRIEENTTPVSHNEQEAECTTEQANEPANHPQLPPPRPAHYAPGAIYRPAQTAEPCPATYLAWSIILLICCCSYKPCSRDRFNMRIELLQQWQHRTC